MWLQQINKILKLAIPLIISNVAIIGMGVIDTLMAGQASAEDLAGLAIGANIWLIIEVIMGGLISAITPRIARFFGAKQFNDITQDTQQSILFGTLFGLISMFVLLSLISFIPLLGATEEVTLVAQGYSKIIAFSFPVSGLCWALFSLMEGHGLMRFVVLSSLLALVLNIIFDYLFVFGLVGLPALGGIGCAWTTTVIYWLWGLGCVIYTIKQPLLKRYQIFSHWPKPDFARWRSILALGLPIALALLAEEGFFSVTALLVAPLGTHELGAHQITIQVVSLVLMLGLGIGQATAIRVATSIGEGRTQAMKKQLFASFILISTASLFVGVFVFLLRENLPSWFTQENSVIVISSSIMLLAPIYLFCDAVQIWAAQTLRGFEDMKVPMFIQIFAYWLIGFPLGYSLAMTDFWGHEYGIYGFWIGILAGVIAGSLFLSIRLYRKVLSYS